MGGIFFALPAVDIGSDTAVTRFNTSQGVGDGDRIAGFASLDAGFFLDTPSVTGIFDSFFAVSGELILNYGTLILGKDLVLRNVSSIETWGNIAGNGHIFELASSIKTVPNSTDPRCTISFISQTAAPADVTEVSWAPDDDFLAVASETAGDDVEVFSWDGSTLTFEDGVSIGNDAFSIKWHPTNNFIAAGADGGFLNDEIFIYEFSGGTLTLLDSVSLGLFGVDVRGLDWRPDGDFLAAGSDDASVRVYPVSGGGILGTPEVVAIGADINTVSWNNDGTFLALGTDLFGGDELQIYSFTTGPPTLTLDSSINIGQQVNSVAWNRSADNEDIIAIGLDGGSDNLQLYRHATGSLTQIPTLLAIGTNVNAVDWRFDGICIAAGLDSNAGTEVRTYRFRNETLTENDGAEVGFNVNTVAWSRAGQYLATGDDNSDASVYEYDVFSLNVNQVTMSDVRFILNGDVTFQDVSITFTGDSIIDGKGYTLSLESTTTLFVESNTSLTFRDVKLKGIHGATIAGADSTSNIIFDDVGLVLDGDYTFSQAHFDVLHRLTIEGDTHSFNYQTDQVSTITSKAQLILSEGVTFNYDPSIASKSLLNLLDNTASIFLKNATLATTTTGIQLERGTLFIDGKSFLINTGTVAAEGIVFGDGSDATNNLCVEWLPAAQLEHVSGYFRSANV